MSEVRINGVDTIKFDDGESSGLGLGRDMRPFKVKYKLFFDTIVPLVLSVFFLIFSLLLWNFSEVSLMLSAYFAFQWGRKRKRFQEKNKSIFGSPKYLKYNRAASRVDISPKELVKPVKKAAKGIGEATYFLGHELNTNQEVHADDSKMRTHLVIFGTTGSGKTETIVSICVNFLTHASGFILVDGKGDTLLFAKCFSICRAYGRTDDLYLLNFMDPGLKDGEKRVETITNTFNFLVDSSAAEADEIIGGLLPSDDGGGSGMWEGRAATGINSLNKAVYYLKDNGYIEIDPDTYRGYFGLNEFVELAMNEDIPKEKRGGLWSLLKSINYKPPSADDPNPKQNPATEEQFQYITMQYTETFNMLAEQYRHITVSQVPDISITDVVLRRRILLVLLPSLAKSPQSVRNLGRIVIAMTRNVSSKAIGSRVEGNYEQVIESKPTAAINSFGLIFDEFGTYATKGASTLPAQVRSLNMVCLFAGQDYAAFKRGDEIEAETIFANCTLKWCLKLEDPGTYDKFNQSAGEMYVVTADSFEAKDTAFGRKYTESKSARVEKRPVLDLRDLKAQKAGWGTLIYGSETYRLKSFYADPIMTPKARVNHFLEVRRPGYSTVQSMRNGVNAVHEKFIELINSDWESKQITMRRLIGTFSSTFPDQMKTYEQVERYVDEHPEVDVPNETEFAVFMLSAHIKKVELVDHNIAKAVKQSVGIDDSDEIFDDDILLGNDGDQLFSYQGPAPDDVNDQSGFEQKNAPSLGPVSENMSSSNEQEESSNAVNPPKPSINHDDMFSKIDDAIDKKEQRLKKGVLDSFDSLEAIQLSAFEIQERLQTLESALLKKSGRDVDVGRVSSLTARNTVIEMGIKTNVAIISEQDKKVKSPSYSSQQVKDMIKRVVGKERV
jgi:hypothetical protein